MRVRVARAGKETTIEVDLAAGTVEIDGVRHPFAVVATSPMKVELEIDGERVVVDQWPTGMATPPGPVDVNGERWTVGPIEATASRSNAPATPTALPSAPPPAEVVGSGTPILPPMPGKVIEVRVAEGEHVAKGQVLLILEAMKMRNEIMSPIAGCVVGLKVKPGSSVRAREPMLTVAPD